MLILAPFFRIVCFLFLFHLSNAGCLTPPFCEAYPECSRSCLGGVEDGNNDSFAHSYQTDMKKICSTGSTEKPLVDQYRYVFDCIIRNCTIPERQEAWNQLVDNCGESGFTVNGTLKPLEISAHRKLSPPNLDPLFSPL